MNTSTDTSDEDRLVPPVEMLFDGSSSADEFVRFGESFCQYILIPRARMTGAETVLDVGCGNGSVARALRHFLSPAGRYEGLDVNLQAVQWLQDRYREFPNFTFTHADIYNKMYNPSGRYLTADYRLPFPAETFSVVLLKSVFTHMMPADVKVYLQEVGRVLRPGGCAVITYFLLNVESRQLVEAGADQLAMRLPFGDDDLCRVASLEMPEQATAHDEERIRLYYLEAGLSLTDISFGNWSGRSSLLGLQDLVIALRR